MTASYHIFMLCPLSTRKNLGRSLRTCEKILVPFLHTPQNLLDYIQSKTTPISSPLEPQKKFCPSLFGPQQILASPLEYPTKFWLPLTNRSPPPSPPSWQKNNTILTMHTAYSVVQVMNESFHSHVDFTPRIKVTFIPSILPHSMAG